MGTSEEVHMVGASRFEEPPVREVSLTVFFEPIATLQALNLAALRMDWSSDYPKVSEVPPRPPLRTEGRFREYLGSNSFWPMPLTAFANERGNQTIELQNDRFGIVWRFDRSPKAYPGYDHLSNELLVRFVEFRSALTVSIDHDPVPVAASISYSNHIEGYDAATFALGVLTGWTVQNVASPQPDLASLYLHYCDPTDDDSVSVNITIDSPVEAERIGPSCSLELHATSSVAGDELAETLNRTHEAVHARFRQLINEKLEQRWGKRDDQS
jgi:uncharacterized protein (TIGR04255 family)